MPSSASRRRLPPGVKPEKVVGRQEFQQVASVLLEEMKSREDRTSSKEEEDEEEGGKMRPTRRAAVQGRKKAAKIIDQDDQGAEDGEGGGMSGRNRSGSEGYVFGQGMGSGGNTPNIYQILNK